MFNYVQDYVKTILPSKCKISPSGWLSFNAPCCTHNGESVDTRSRAGLHADPDGSLSYHCFNCNFKASYQPGRHLTFKFRKLLSWLGADDGEVRRLVIEAIRIRDLISPEDIKQEPEETFTFDKRSLPKRAVSFESLMTFCQLNDQQPTVLHSFGHFHDAVKYCYDRDIDMTQYQFYLSDSLEHNLAKRVIIPFYWQNELVGYTARAIYDDVKPKYYSNHEPNFVFNTNMQRPDWKFVIVCEGPFDAMAVDGVAILGNEVSEQQANIIDSLGRQVIVVADRDKAGVKMIDAAIKYNWSVSYPVWQETCKDINEAVVKYGKLFVLKTIIDATEINKLKIELKKKIHA
jgi:hypothetical protein